MWRNSLFLAVLVVQVLNAAAVVTVYNDDEVSVDAYVQRNGSTYTSTVTIASKTSYDFPDPTSSGTIQVKYNVYSASAVNAVRDSVGWYVPNHSYTLRFINASGADWTPRIMINGSQVDVWGVVANGAEVSNVRHYWTGSGTLTVRKLGPNTLASPSGGYWLADSVPVARGATKPTFIFVGGGEVYKVTRCIENFYLSEVKGTWYRDGVAVRRENIPPGGRVCHTYDEYGFTPHTYNETIAWWLTRLEDGELVGELVEQTVGTDYGNSTTLGGSTNVVAATTPPGGGQTVWSTNFASTSSNAPIRFTETNLVGGLTEGTAQAGFNALISAENTAAQSIVAAIGDAKNGIVAAVNAIDIGGSGGTNVVNVNVTNLLTLTNIGDTNLVSRWDAWTNAGELARSQSHALTNLANTVPTHEGIATGQGTLTDIEGLVTAPTVSTGSAGDWTVSVAGYSFDLNPMNHPDVAALMVACKGWVRWLVYFLFVLAVFKRLDQCIGEGMLTQQGRVPNVQVLGNSVGATLAPVYVTVIATALLGLLAALLTLAQASNVAFLAISADPFSGAGGAVGMGVWLANQCLPFDTIIGLGIGYLIIIWQSRGILWGTQLVIRLLLA